eukprot:CAMPEP_0206034006 /NCGR_PEP_ID=MMETSP1466-20131121/1059_1 /ASSEMBLY_ACC=CAM_ASM_001126 /TAXON_ID=44452 /ORGANISM="Pavlova gyrans, Strain CCMP608" /LENGTH=57 /DNA_ID=CAMNT_0053408257 /DNA_START=38 /DNA_END=209 /DNA_ORIENTATION=+
MTARRGKGNIDASGAQLHQDSAQPERGNMGPLAQVRPTLLVAALTLNVLRLGATSGE